MNLYFLMLKEITKMQKKKLHKYRKNRKKFLASITRDTKHTYESSVRKKRKIWVFSGKIPKF